MKFFSKYHKGEQLVQELVGETRQAEFNGQAISTSIIEGALNFIAEQEYVAVSITDDQNNVWVSVLSGDRGFMTAPDSKTVLIEKDKTDIKANDIFWNTLQKNKKIGMLIIELANRRRIRINGMVSSFENNIVQIKVYESYPNCMKYIQRRHIVNRKKRSTENFEQVSTGIILNQSQKTVIRTADTFFIGSANPKGNLDVSHRGGDPGFIEIVDDKTLRIPDYKGNSMFNTFGNFLLNEYAGVVFWDFEQGKLLQMTGKAKIYWDNPGTEKETAGTGRYWEFEVDKWMEQEIGRDFTWEFLDYSPHNPISNFKQSTSAQNLVR